MMELIQVGISTPTSTPTTDQKIALGVGLGIGLPGLLVTILGIVLGVRYRNIGVLPWAGLKHFRSEALSDQGREESPVEVGEELQDIRSNS